MYETTFTVRTDLPVGPEAQMMVRRYIERQYNLAAHGTVDSRCEEVPAASPDKDS